MIISTNGSFISGKYIKHRFEYNQPCQRENQPFTLPCQRFFFTLAGLEIKIYMNKEIIDYQAKWDSLSLESDYIIACELLQLYEAGNLKELGAFLQKNKAMQQRRAEVELEFTLKNLMETILLWLYDSIFQTDEAMNKIKTYRKEIELSLECEGCLSEQNIYDKWEIAFEKANDWAVALSKTQNIITRLTWVEVFNNQYIYKNG